MLSSRRACINRNPKQEADNQPKERMPNKSVIEASKENKIPDKLPVFAISFVRR